MSTFNEMMKFDGGVTARINCKETEMGGAVTNLPRLLQEARAKLEQADVVLRSSPLTPTVLELCRRYFLTGGAPKAEELVEIHRIISSTRTGLASDATFKVWKWDVFDDNPETDGAVNLRKEHDSKSAEGLTLRGYGGRPEKPHHVFVEHMKPTDPGRKRSGMIKISEYALSDDTRGVCTLIHEATHRFAGTWDYYYFDDAGLVARPADFANKEYALGNADSYAWFVMKI